MKRYLGTTSLQPRKWWLLFTKTSDLIKASDQEFSSSVHLLSNNTRATCPSHDKVMVHYKPLVGLVFLKGHICKECCQREMTD